MDEHTPLPWSYRPYKHDDWGWIRGPVMEGEEIGELVAKAHCWVTEDEKNDHRREKTDPYAANAAYIVKACNAFPDLVKALERLLRFCDDATEYEASHPSAYSPYLDARALLDRVKSPGGPDAA
jgi:hypothetical protein